MAFRPKHQRNKRFLALAGIVVMVCVAGLFLILDLPSSTSLSGMSGTMSDAGSASNSATAITWESGRVRSSLDDAISIQWEMESGVLDANASSLRLFASRDETFSQVEDCFIDNVTVDDELDGRFKIESRFEARSITCLDAGTWYVLVVDETSVRQVLPNQVEIENGEVDLEQINTSHELGFNQNLEVSFLAHRPAASDGFDGIVSHPVQVWITDGKDVCAAEANPLNILRDPVRAGQSWKTESHTVELSLASFKKIKDYSPFETQDAVLDINSVTTRGDCDVSEGSYQVMLGPLEQVRGEVGSVFVHAPPPTISNDSIELTISSGEVAEVELGFKNVSANSINWSARAASRNADQWLIPSEDQVLSGKKRTRSPITISAFDLEPGIYSTELVVTLDDFYGTEVRIPTEIRVLRSMSHSVEDPTSTDVLPGEMELGNYPNPFSSSTTIRIALQEADQVSVTVFDMSGRQVSTLVDNYLSAGTHEFPFYADALPSGTYLYRIITSSGQKSETMTLVK